MMLTVTRLNQCGCRYSANGLTRFLVHLLLEPRVRALCLGHSGQSNLNT